MAKLTIKVTKTAYYNGALVFPNTIIKNYKGDKVPSWATLASGKELKGDEVLVKNSQTPVQSQIPVNLIKDDGENTQKEKNGENAQTTDEQKKDETPVVTEEKTEIQLQEELDALLDESVEKGIIIENAENKTVNEQITELKVLLGK